MQEAKPRKKRKKRMRLPNGVGSVHLIEDSKSRRNPWRARVPSHVEIDPVKGTAVQKYITVGYYPTEVDAIDALMNYRKNPYTLEASVCTFEDVAEMWKAKKYPDLSKASQSAYNSAFKNTTPLHKMKMRDIRTTHLEGLMATIEGGFNVQARLKVYLGQIFKYAMEHDIIQKNYVEFIKTRDKDEGTKRTDIPAEDRAKIWAAAQEGDTNAEIALIYIYTGMRASELLEVKKANINLNSRIMIGGLKTEAGRDRHIPIHKDILPFIERLMKTEGEYLITRIDKKGNLNKYNYDYLSDNVWSPLMKKLGFSKYTPHYCRHTCATMLREVNAPEDIRKLILGHKSADITDRYTHVSDAMLLEAIDMLPGRK